MSNRTSLRAVSAAQVSGGISPSSRRRGAALLAAAVATVGWMSTSASAQVFYEPWDYGAGTVGTNYANTSGTPNFNGYTNAMTNGVWASAFSNAANDDKIFNDVNLQVSGLAAFAGDLAGSDQRNTGVKQPRVPLQSGGYGAAGTTSTVYYSMAFRVNNLGTTNATANILGGFNTAVGTQTGTANTVGARLMIRIDPVDPAKYNLGIASNAAVIQYAPDGGSSSGFKQFAANDNLFLVGSYSTNTGAGDDVQSLWINPSSANFGAGTAPAPDASVTGGDIGTYTSFLFRTQNVNTPSALRYDELRIDQSWAQVTPPTGSVFTAASSTDWSNSGSWDAGGVPNANGAFAYLNNAAGGTVNVDTGQTVGTVTIRSGNGYTIAGTGGTLTINAGTSRSAINVLPVSNPTPVAASHAISAPVLIANDVAIHTGTSQTLTVTGGITGTGTLTKDGPGTLVLNGGINHTGGISAVQGLLQLKGTNSYTGPTSFIGVGIAGGPANTLAIDGDAALGAVPGSPTVNLILSRPSAGLTLRFDADMTLNVNRTIANIGNSPIYDTNGHDVTINGKMTGGATTGNPAKRGLGTLFLRGDNGTSDGGSFITIMTCNEGTINVLEDKNMGKAGNGFNVNSNTAGQAILQFAGSFTDSARAMQFSGTAGTNVIDAMPGVDVALTGALSGASGLALQKTGTGRVTFGGTAANSIVGPINVKAGTLQLNKTAGVNAIASNTTVGDGTATAATLAYAASDQIADSANVTVNGSAAVLDLGANHNETVNTVTVDGGGSITGTGTSTLTTATTFEMKSGSASAVLAGAGKPLNKTTGGTATLTGANTYTGGTNVQAGTLVVNRLHENNAVAISANATLQVAESSPKLSEAPDFHPSGNNAFVSRPSSLTIANDAGAPLVRVWNGTLDLANNDLVIDYDVTSPITDIEDAIRSGYNGGDWLGKGITSSTAASLDAFGAYVLAVCDNNEIPVAFSTFSGQTVDPTTVLVKFTHHSDINMDGVVTVNDSVLFNGNYSEGDFAKWSTGDQNYDGVYSINDSVLFNGSYDESLMSLPEPASAGLLGLLALGMARRRKARQI